MIRKHTFNLRQKSNVRDETMNYKRVLTIQDISCVGQCSLTVALPVISACGIETSVLPSAVLSTHTMGFTGFTFRDLTEDMPAICAHWKKEGITFDGIHTGYLGSARQIEYVKAIRRAAEYYSLPLLDLYACSGLQPNVPVIAEKYCPDGLHPNKAGYVILTRRIRRFLEAL